MIKNNVSSMFKIVCIIVFFASTLLHDNIGTIPIIIIAGITIGIIVELKYGSPTEILFLEKISINKGYVVPKKTEPVSAVTGCR